jgi:hypothetical protein
MNKPCVGDGSVLARALGTVTKITDVTICRGGNGRKRAAHERTINSIDDAADLSIE